MGTPSYQNILSLDYKLQMKKSSPNAHKKVIEIDFSFQIWTLSLSIFVCLSFYFFHSPSRKSKALKMAPYQIQFDTILIFIISNQLVFFQLVS